MRHRKTGVKLNRTTSHRQAMFRNMVTSLFKHDRIRTTDVKAKELRRWADHIITLAKRGDLHARRQAMAIIREKDVVHKLFEEAGNRFGTINGGYTRIIKVGHRPGDAAPVSLIELVGVEDRDKSGGKKSKPASKKKTKPAEGEKAQAKKDQVEKSKSSEADKASDSVKTAQPVAESSEAETTDTDEKPEEKAAKGGSESELTETAGQNKSETADDSESKDKDSEPEDLDKQE